MWMRAFTHAFGYVRVSLSLSLSLSLYIYVCVCMYVYDIPISLVLFLHVCTYDCTCVLSRNCAHSPGSGSDARAHGRNSINSSDGMPAIRCVFFQIFS